MFAGRHNAITPKKMNTAAMQQPSHARSPGQGPPCMVLVFQPSLKRYGIPICTIAQATGHLNKYNFNNNPKSVQVP